MKEMMKKDRPHSISSPWRENSGTWGFPKILVPKLRFSDLVPRYKLPTWEFPRWRWIFGIIGEKNPWQDAVRQRSHGFEQGADSVREVDSRPKFIFFRQGLEERSDDRAVVKKYKLRHWAII